MAYDKCFVGTFRGFVITANKLKDENAVILLSVLPTFYLSDFAECLSAREKGLKISRHLQT